MQECWLAHDQERCHRAYSDSCNGAKLYEKQVSTSGHFIINSTGDTSIIRAPKNGKIVWQRVDLLLEWYNSREGVRVGRKWGVEEFRDQIRQADRLSDGESFHVLEGSVIMSSTSWSLSFLPFDLSPRSCDTVWCSISARKDSLCSICHWWRRHCSPTSSNFKNCKYWQQHCTEKWIYRYYDCDIHVHKISAKFVHTLVWWEVCTCSVYDSLVTLCSPGSVSPGQFLPCVASPSSSDAHTTSLAVDRIS